MAVKEIVIALALLTALPVAVQSAEPVSFESAVLPVLRAHCVSCHGREATVSGLDLRTASLVLEGSDNGPVVVAGSAAKSKLYQRIADDSMPPGDALKLLPEQKEVIRQWINTGINSGPVSNDSIGGKPAAKRWAISEEDRRHWSFQRLARPAVPETRGGEGVRTSIDSFVLAKLEARQLKFSPEAARPTLLRRTFLDLTGLPPSPAEIRQYLNDDSAGAYEALLDRLLASPHFGERWGRHWLDAAGYVDTYGREVQAKAFTLGKGKWKYRDYVIGSFNDDKPYDRFLTEQIAGDELAGWRGAERYTPEIREMLIATGFLRTAEDPTNAPERDIALHRYGVLQDTVKILTSNVLGLTVACAQCHDHKLEPIAQRDYYRLTAILGTAYNPRDWRTPQKRILPDVSKNMQAEIDAHNERLDEEKRPLSERLEALERPYEERLLVAKLAALPEAIRRDTKTALLIPAQKRDEVQKYLVRKFGKQLAVSSEKILEAMEPSERERWRRLQEEIKTVDKRRRSYGEIHALFDVGPSAKTFVLAGGNFETPAAGVEPGVLAVLDDPGQPFGAEPADPNALTSGRRLAFARWLTSPNGRGGALVARVMANRLWRRLFGEGIVATPENLGKSGAAATHPELLEWLAADFVENGWRVKPLIKRMMMSAVYRQASARKDDERAYAADPENKLLWKMRLRRLESEAIRDSVLAVSGMLDRRLGGPAVMIETRPSGMVVIKEQALREPGDRFRRSIYLVQRRNNNLTMLTVFDQPVMRTNCLRRDSSAVVLQSLAMLHGGFVLKQSRFFAERIAEFAGADTARQIETAFELALARSPSDRERTWSRELLQRESRREPQREGERAGDTLTPLAALAHVLLNTSEFLYVE